MLTDPSSSSPRSKTQGTTIATVTTLTAAAAPRIVHYRNTSFLSRINHLTRRPEELTTEIQLESGGAPVTSPLLTVVSSAVDFSLSWVVSVGLSSAKAGFSFDRSWKWRWSSFDFILKQYLLSQSCFLLLSTFRSPNLFLHFIIFVKHSPVLSIKRKLW